jgi:hypothetical protein
MCCDLDDLERPGPKGPVQMTTGSDRDRNQVLIDLRKRDTVEIAARGKGREPLADFVQYPVGRQGDFFRIRDAIRDGVKGKSLPLGKERDIFGGDDAAQGNQGHMMDRLDVPRRPGDNLGNMFKILARHRHIEAAADAPDAGDHIRIGLPQFVQLRLVPPFPTRSILAAVDMKIEPGEPGPAQLTDEVEVEPDAVRHEERFHSVAGDESHDLEKVRIQQRLAAGNLHVVAVPHGLAGLDIGQDGLERPVSFERAPKTLRTVEIAAVGDVHPAPGIVGQGPRKAVEPPSVDAHGQPPGNPPAASP